MDGLVTAATNGMVPPWAVRRSFDVSAYHRMAEAGVFGETEHCELIAGEIIEMSPIGGPHIGTVMALTRLLVLAAGDHLSVSVQNSLRLGNWSEPQPDIVLLRRRADAYRGSLPPLVEDAVLVVEVAQSSLRYDSEVKKPLYARHGVAEFWIVDVVAGIIEVCRQPVDGAYVGVTRLRAGDHVEPLALPGARIAVAEIVSATDP